MSPTSQNVYLQGPTKGKIAERTDESSDRKYQ